MITVLPATGLLSVILTRMLHTRLPDSSLLPRAEKKNVNMNFVVLQIMCLAIFVMINSENKCQKIHPHNTICESWKPFDEVL